MKILITGVSGMLGYDLWQKFKMEHTLLGVGRSNRPDYVESALWTKLDLTDGKSTYEIITKFNPDILIHLAAASDVDYCQKFPEEAYKNNAVATNNIALACQRFDTPLMYFSTDYVFDGENVSDVDKGYTEFCKVNPQSVYAKSKLAGEYYVSHLVNKYFIVRTALLFGLRRDNLASYVIDSALQGKEISIITNQIGSPTYTKDLAEAIEWLIQTGYYGTYHLTNSGNCTRQEFIEETLTVAGLQNKAKKKMLTVNEFHYFAPRPKYSALDNYVWKLRGFKPLRHWKEALKEYLITTGRI